ncbi:MAG: AI-2E family transporter, partial [Clostridia bacterium]
ATTDIVLAIISATVNVASVIFTVVLSLIFSVYFLSGKENLIMTQKKLLYAYTPRRHANRISMFLSLSNKVFSNYVRGQLTECLILGVLCYIGMNIIGLDYSLLISTLVTFCALIPLVGAFIGAIGGGLLLLLVNPADALWFVIFFVILQQFEGNVIYPRVVGSSLGLPGIWTLAAVTVMGGIFGIGGILIGTPVAGVAYALIRHNVNTRLQGKSIDKQVLLGSEVDIIYADILYPEKKEVKQKKISFISAFKRKLSELSKK